MRVADRCMQLHGGYHYAGDLPDCTSLEGPESSAGVRGDQRDHEGNSSKVHGIVVRPRYPHAEMGWGTAPKQ